MGSRLVIRESNSFRNLRIAETIGATDEGPNGQIVVWRGGNGTASRPSSGKEAAGYGPGLMLSPISRSKSISEGLPSPFKILCRIFSSHVVPSLQGEHFPQDS